MSTFSMEQMLEQARVKFQQAINQYRPSLNFEEVGIVRYVGESIVRISGLPDVGADELVITPAGKLGFAFNLEPDEVGIVMLEHAPELSVNDEIRRTRRVLDVPVGNELLGRVINPLGQPLDGGGPLSTSKRLPVEQEAPAIMDRAPVSIPLQTGIKAIDALIPIGRGQRELILGDRQTGKSAIALDTIINQKHQNVVCIYCAIGQRRTAIAKLIEDLKTYEAMSYTIVVTASGEDMPGMQFVAPYAATSMAEYFMANGQDVLIVYDDFTRHARVYREISLLLRRPPGREAFPGDIFYIHSRLLERATHLRQEKGGGSLTAFPILETEAQNISAYIPTNLISITDGQIYLSPDLFHKGILPAIDMGRSVSRVGGKAQLPAIRKAVGDLRLAYSQFQELEAFSRFGTHIEKQIQNTLEHGQRIRAVLQQDQFKPMPITAQVTILEALKTRKLDDIPMDKIKQAEQYLQEMAVKQDKPLSDMILQGKTPDAEFEKSLNNWIDQALQPLKLTKDADSPKPPPDSAQTNTSDEEPTEPPAA